MFALAGLRLEWTTVIDGPGHLPPCIQIADNVIRLPSRSGVSSARNTALSAAQAPWVFPLDSDDMVFADGLFSLYSSAVASGCGWAAGNRLLTGGARTPHWFESSRLWAPGELAEHWSAPFAFHPNSVILMRSAALQVGGWPAVPASEDMGLILALSELSSGLSDPAAVTAYRVWSEQAVADPSYGQAKAQAFSIISARINELRMREGRPLVDSPSPGGAHGVLAR